ncbi:MAG: hypothetical protein ABJP70_01735 [Erythrobacter sp.]
MTNEQVSRLWAFVRGDLQPEAFESWLFKQRSIEATLGEELHLELLSADYKDQRDTIPQLRSRLAKLLEPTRKCECPTVRDLSAVPMGGDFYFEKVFEPLVTEVEFGKPKWWLYISTCSICCTNWLVAQDDLIYDEFFMHRVGNNDVNRAKEGNWPSIFRTYESVLKLGRTVSSPPIFFNDFAASLIWTVQDLRNERPAISVSEIAYLLGLTDKHAAKLASKAGFSE